MALFLGSSEKLKLWLSSNRFSLIIPAPVYTVNGVRLLSSDNYILKDSNGLYLTVNNVRLLSLDNYILKDSQGLYLTVEEDE